MLKLLLCVYVMSLCIGAIAAVFVFVYDVIKWHSMERKENIISSADEIYSKGGVLNGRYGSIGSDRGNNGTGNGTIHGTGTGNNDSDRGTGDGDNNNYFFN